MPRGSIPLVTHHMVYRCSPRHPLHGVLVVNSLSTTPCTMVSCAHHITHQAGMTRVVLDAADHGRLEGSKEVQRVLERSREVLRVRAGGVDSALIAILHLYTPELQRHQSPRGTRAQHISQRNGPSSPTLSNKFCRMSAMSCAISSSGMAPATCTISLSQDPGTRRARIK